MLKKLIYILGVILLVLVVLLIGAYYYLIKLPLPVTRGEIKLQDLQAPVEVLRDPVTRPCRRASRARLGIFSRDP